MRHIWLLPKLPPIFLCVISKLSATYIDAELSAGMGRKLGGKEVKSAGSKVRSESDEGERGQPGQRGKSREKITT